MGCLFRQEDLSMHRFYVERIENGVCRLSPEDQHHALHVLRLHCNDSVEIIADRSRFLAVFREDGILEIREPLPSTEPSLQITLFQGLPKSDKMDWIVQKAVEIGVVHIVPVITRRCVAQILPKDYEKKRLRWERIARESGKQSGRCRIPSVSDPISLTDLLRFPSLPEFCVVPWEEEHTMGPSSFIASHPAFHSLGILIGPEGGLDSEEIGFLGSVFQPLTLGPRILRTETAGLATAAAFLALTGEMG